MRVMTLLLCGIVFATCCPIREVILPPKESCLPGPPPKEVPVIPVETGCPPNFVLCLDVDGGLALEHDIKALRRYNSEAWERCGIQSDAGR